MFERFLWARIYLMKLNNSTHHCDGIKLSDSGWGTVSIGHLSCHTTQIQLLDMEWISISWRMLSALARMLDIHAHELVIEPSLENVKSTLKYSEKYFTKSWRSAVSEGESNIKLMWILLSRQILVCEKTIDNVSGSCAQPWLLGGGGSRREDRDWATRCFHHSQGEFYLTLLIPKI